MTKIFFGALGGYVIKSLLPIIIIPIYIKYWGNQEYGFWLESMAASAIISLLGFGLNNFGINRCQIAYKKGSVAKYKIYDSLLSLNFVIYIFAHLLSLIYLLFIDIFINFEYVVLVLIFGFYNAALILYSYLSVSLRIIEKFHIGLYISIAYNIVLYSGVAFFVSKGLSLTYVAMWMLLMTNLGILFYYYVLHYVYGIPYRFRYSPKAFLIYIKKSYKVMYFQLGDYFRVQLPILFLGTVVSSVQVVTYTVNRTLANILSKAFLIVHSTVMQKITSNFAEGNKIDQSLLYKLIFYLLVPVLTLVSVLLVEFYDFALNIWIGENSKSIYNLIYFKLLITSSYLYCIWNLGTIFLVATNNFSVLAKLSLLHGIGFIIFSAFGFYLFNFLGFLIACIIAELIFGVTIINILIYKSINMSFKDILLVTSFMITNIITFFLIFLYIQSNLYAFITSTLITILFTALLINKNKEIFLEKT